MTRHSFQTLPRGQLLLSETNLLVSVRGSHIEGGSLGHVQSISKDYTVHQVQKLVEDVDSKELTTVDSKAVEKGAEIGR